jgi:hypothetical protein
MKLFAATLVASALLMNAAHAAPTLDAAARGEIIAALVRQLDAYYVDPTEATLMGQALRAKQQHGDYDNIDEAKAFADVLTADLRAVSHDKHLRVAAAANPQPPMPASGGPTPEQKAAMLKQVTARNFGIAKVETLEGNIGYLDLRGFDPTEFAAPAITAAMTQLAGSAA